MSVRSLGSQHDVAHDPALPDEANCHRTLLTAGQQELLLHFGEGARNSCYFEAAPGGVSVDGRGWLSDSEAWRC